MPIFRIDSPFLSRHVETVSDLLSTSNAARDALESLKLNELTSAINLLTQSDIFSKLRDLTSYQSLLGDISSFSNDYGFRNRIARQLQEFLASPHFTAAKQIANSVQQYNLPSWLNEYQAPLADLTFKIANLRDLGLFSDPAYIEAFSHTSAISGFLSQTKRIEADLLNAANLLANSQIPEFRDLASYREFLDSAGLYLRRWPRVRPLSSQEKERRFKARLKQKGEPVPVKKARTLVYRYELMLREIIHAGMAAAYGEDWPYTRLAQCDCNDLLGRWDSRGGDVLEHADYAHYQRIMTDPQHFQAVFEVGFDDATELKKLLKRAGNLRAASHHARPFSTQDLLELRLTWRLIEKGLIALTEDYEFDFNQ